MPRDFDSAICHRVPMDHTSAQAWLDRYLAAWHSYDRNDVAALFSPDVQYRYHPYDDPIVGRDAVVASWMVEGEPDDGASSRDAPGTYDAHYEAFAVDGDVVVATGVSSYRDRPDGPVAHVFHNCFLIRFDADGRCREFTEFYIEQR